MIKYNGVFRYLEAHSCLRTQTKTVFVNALLSCQLPEEARELDKELRGITKEKNEAVRGQDFEKVHFYIPFCRHNYY